MTPGARLKAVIDILTAFEGASGPLDRLVLNWARQNRYAGSKDRRFIQETLFELVRRRGEVARLIRSEEPRALILGFMALQKKSLEEMALFFDGEKYNPDPLTEAEREAYLSALASQESFLPSINFPTWLSKDDFELPDGADFEEELAALSIRAPLDLRVNTLKSKRDQVLERFAEEGIQAEETSLSEDGIRILQNPDQPYVNLRGHELYENGTVEIQDEGLQVASSLVGAEPGMMVLDLCAGAGGKTLALAAHMKNKGQIFATDTNAKRLKPSKGRLDRAGIRNTQIKLIKPWSSGDGGEDPDFQDQQAQFDRVLLDVPCSGSGTWRRNPGAKWLLTSDLLEAYSDVQMNILMRAKNLVKLGGRLIYVTCSVLKAENSRIISAFLAENDAFEVLPADQAWAGGWPRNCQKADGFLQLTPESANTDGTFVAVLQRHS